MRAAIFAYAVVAVCALGASGYGYDIKYTVTDLGSLAGPTSVAKYINTNGRVAGWADDDPVYRYAHAWVWSGSGVLQNLGSFGGPQSVSAPTGLNDNGWIVGQSDVTSGGATHGFLWTGSGTIQDIGSLGGQSTIPQGINNAGVIVGESQAVDGTYHGFIYSNGVMTDTGTSIAPTAINNNGQIAGEFVASNGNTAEYRAFISSAGSYSQIGSLSDSGSYLVRINDAGTGVGYSYAPSGYLHAIVFSDHLQDLGTLGGPASFANGINSEGVVVGAADIDIQEEDHAFIYSQAKGMVDLNTLIDPNSDWDLLGANDINGAGEIVGTGINPSGVEHAFLLIPVDVPEPSSLWLMFALASLASATSCRKRFRGKKMGL